MGSPHQLHGLDGIADRRKADGELDSELEAPLLGGQEHDLGIDRHLAGLFVGTPRHRSQGALEAGGISDREQLLGIGAIALAPHLRGQAQIDLQVTV